MDFSARPVRSGHSQPLFAGVDVGGTNMKIGIVDDQGHSVASMSMPTESHRGLPDAIERMASALEDLQQRQGVPPTNSWPLDWPLRAPWTCKPV